MLGFVASRERLSQYISLATQQSLSTRENGGSNKRTRTYLNCGNIWTIERFLGVQSFWSSGNPGRRPVMTETLELQCTDVGGRKGDTERLSSSGCCRRTVDWKRREKCHWDCRSRHSRSYLSSPRLSSWLSSAKGGRTDRAPPSNSSCRVIRNIFSFSFSFSFFALLQIKNYMWAFIWA